MVSGKGLKLFTVFDVFMENTSSGFCASVDEDAPFKITKQMESIQNESDLTLQQKALCCWVFFRISKPFSAKHPHILTFTGGHPARQHIYTGMHRGGGTCLSGIILGY